MALLALWTSNPDALLSLSIEQIVSTAGDGKLRDGSNCSTELRAFLSQVENDKLGEYAEQCLSSGFNKSGMVLQDIVNELGRRLEYTVVNGRYQGTSNAIGNDGLWRSPEGQYILIEVKTTDAYRVGLNTIANYRDKLRVEGTVGDNNSILIIVGREDTGELEAQVRGSKHAWDMRLISVESLVRLVKLKVNTEVSSTAAKIRSLLIPMEYTRLDALIDVMFTTAKDVETPAEPEEQPESREESSFQFDFTDPELLQQKRDQIVSAFAKQHNTKLVRKSRALYWTADHNLRIVCTLSKRYAPPVAPYWFAYHPRWDDFLKEAQKGFVVFSGMDLGVAFAIPAEIFRTHLHELNTTTKEDGGVYWHVKIIEPQPHTYALQMPKTGKHLSLSPFAVPVSVD